MPGDSLYKVFQDSISLLKQANENLGKGNSFKDDINFYLAIAGGIGTLIGIIGFYYQWKSKKPQDYVFRLARTMMEKEDTQSQLEQSQKQLSTVENRLSELQDQIKKDLPLEARKAVLTDRLDESLQNMKKYYEDVIITKQKLLSLNTNVKISDELLKAIESEIEPKHKLKEKISTYKTYLTAFSSLSGIAFAVIPETFGRIVGTAFLLGGLPFLLLILRNSALFKSEDRSKTNKLLKFIAFSFLTAITFLFAGFIGLIYLTSEREYVPDELVYVFAFSAIVTLVLSYFTIKYYKHYKKTKAGAKSE